MLQSRNRRRRVSDQESGFPQFVKRFRVSSIQGRGALKLLYCSLPIPRLQQTMSVLITNIRVARCARHFYSVFRQGPLSVSECVVGKTQVVVTQRDIRIQAQGRLKFV